MNPETLGRRLALAGAAFAGLSLIVLSSRSPLRALPFALWAAAPYLALRYAAGRLGRTGPVLGAGAAALVAEAAVRAAVFLWPRSSTAAVLLLFSPVYILAVIMPAGAALGWVGETLWDKGGPRLKGGLALTGAALLALEFLAIAKPERLPLNLARRRAALATIGEARVVLAGDSRETLVSDATAWFQVGELDGLPGEEVLVVDRKGASILDSSGYKQKDFAAFDDPDGRLWSWYSRLVALEDGYAVVQTGGGFQKTEVRLLDGSLLWAYKPDETGEPSALRPADLDGDGQVEFYAASARKVCRLDAAMKEAWCVPASGASIPVLAPKRGKAPGWVVVSEPRRMLRVLDPDGRELGSFVPSKEFFPFCAADLPSGRFLVSGGRRLELFTADGRPAPGYPVDLEGFSVVNAVPVAARKGRAPLLAVLSAARGVERLRLRLLEEGGGTAYEEVFAKPVSLLPLRRADGTDALLLGEASRLRALSWEAAASLNTRPSISYYPRKKP